MGLLDDLRTAIQRSGEAPSVIAERAGLPRSATSRLLAGKGCTVENAEKLAGVLGMRIKLERMGKARKER